MWPVVEWLHVKAGPTPKTPLATQIGLDRERRGKSNLKVGWEGAGGWRCANGEGKGGLTCSKHTVWNSQRINENIALKKKPSKVFREEKRHDI